MRLFNVNETLTATQSTLPPPFNNIRIISLGTYDVVQHQGRHGQAFSTFQKSEGVSWMSVHLQDAPFIVFFYSTQMKFRG